MKTTLYKMIGSAVFVSGVAVSFVATPSQAGTLATCSTENVKLGGVYSTACSGAFEGNDTGEGGTLLTRLDAGLFASSFSSNQQVSWSLEAKSDENDNKKLNIKNKYGFDADENVNNGTWGFTEALSTNTFVVSLKSSLGYSAYLFKDYNWLKNGLTGVFSTIGVSLNSNNEMAQALSHASLFTANITTITPPPLVVNPLPPVVVNQTPTTPVVKETPTTPVVNEEPVVAPPVVNETPTTPVVNEEPVVAPPVVNETPTTPVVNEEPVVAPPAVNETPTTPVVNEEPVVAPPMVNETPTTPVVNEEPVVAPPVVNETPTTPVVNEEPVVAPPVVNETPTTPVMNEEPVVAPPVVNETPTTPVMNEEPVVPPVVNETPTTPVMNEEPAIAKVPEPATLVGLAFALGGMLSVRRRKSH